MRRASLRAIDRCRCHYAALRLTADATDEFAVGTVMRDISRWCRITRENCAISSCQRETCAGVPGKLFIKIPVKTFGTTEIMMIPVNCPSSAGRRRLTPKKRSFVARDSRTAPT